MHSTSRANHVEEGESEADIDDDLKTCVEASEKQRAENAKKRACENRRHEIRRAARLPQLSERWNVFMDASVDTQENASKLVQNSCNIKTDMFEANLVRFFTCNHSHPIVW